MSLAKQRQKFIKNAKKSGKNQLDNIKENFIDRLPNARRVRLVIFEWSLLIIALILLAIAQSIWFKKSYTTEAFTNGGNYAEATLGRVTSLNPLFASSNSEKTLSRLLFATLLTTDSSGHPGPGLAETFSSTENGRVWTLKLREGLNWSDNEPLTADDVIFTISLIQNPALVSAYSSNLANVTVTLNDAGEIVFALPSAYADFSSVLNIPILPRHILGNIDPRKILEHSFSTKPISSGAFMLNAIQTSSSADEKIFYLNANTHYYKGTPRLDRFIVHTYPDTNSIISALTTNIVTSTAELFATDKASITNPTIAERQTAISSGVYAFFNTSTVSLNLRKAIQKGIDIANVRSAAGDSFALDYPLAKSQITLNNYPSLPEQDLNAAKEAIAIMDFEKPLRIIAVKSGYIENTAKIFAEELKNIGLNTSLLFYEENQDFISSILGPRDYDILIYDVELGSDPDLITYYHSSQATATGFNLSNYKNSIVDDIITSARETTDKNLRITKYEAFLKYWVNDAPAIGLYQTNFSYFYNNNVHIFADENFLSTPLDRFTDIENWAINKTIKNRTI